MSTKLSSLSKKPIQLTNDFLKNLFITSDVEEITLILKKNKSRDKSRDKSKIAEKKMVSQYTPSTKALLEPLSERSKRRMIEDITDDNKRIKLIEQEHESDDPDYSYFENKEIGVFLEKWYCANYLCKCGGQFFKYTNLNMPVIDIKCSNHHNHKIEIHGPRYYQVKSTEDNKIYKGYKYFDLENHYIHVGSKRYGEICHNITTTDEDKELLIGYICITYDKINDDTIRIKEDKSFILNTKIYDKEPKRNYYTYITPYRNAIMIDFDINLFDIVYIKSQIINIYQKFNEKIIQKTLPFTFYEKYIKYKLKYLELKNKS
jgi:hypothetical protein